MNDDSFRFGRQTYRVERADPPVVLVEEGGIWRRMTRSEILDHPASTKFWKELKQRGVLRRPSPPGPAGPPTPYKQRLSGGRVRLEVYLSPQAAEALEELVRVHGSRRVAIESLLLSYAGRRK